MVITHSAGCLSETARERETFKYDSLTLSTAQLNSALTPKPIPSTFLSSTQDPVLTAFAQLGLYRLNAGRANISLFDRRYQHIVAEALRPDPPTSKDRPPPNWFNGLTFERSSSVCEHVVTGAAVSHDVPGTDFGLSVGDIPVSIIRNLDKDARFCHIQDPGRQFYAGVPIRSPEGINIGVYCVFDDKPRPQGLSDDEVRFIREISRVVMDYLETKRSNEWYRREQRMIRGLGSFVKGEPTLWRPSEKELEDHMSYEDLPRMREGQLNKQLQPGNAGVGEDLAQRAQQQKTSDPGRNGALQTETRDFQPSTPKSDAPKVFKSNTMPAADPGIGKPQKSSTNQLHGKIDNVFSKAANVIRESIEVEGVLFLDASVRSYGGLVGNIASTSPAQSDGRHSSTGPGSGDDAAPNQHCDVLGFSTSDVSSIVGDATPKEFTGCREWFLQRLLRRFPLGHVWNFDADGTISDHATDSDESSILERRTPLPASPPESANAPGVAPARKTKKRIHTAARIIEMFPGARSVAVVPLWDAQTGRWFAGGFAWTRTPTRTFTEENELTYLRVFGLMAMTEVARLKMRAADKAKTDILGSISHELRSPLHGLVGAVELLRHTDLNALQDGILQTIEASGRTLLDTIDHLLDFAKISAKQSSKTGRRSRATGHPRSPSSPPVESLALSHVPIQLDLLVEEVVESVLAGSSYLTKSEAHSPSALTSMRSPVLDGLPKGQLLEPSAGVQIYLDIEHPAKWSFAAHPGAFRRIVMNLVGNSLKFTNSGFIRVSLRQEEQSKRSAVAGTTHVVLSVSDSGKGMSEEYLRNHIFTPFSQEDSFAPGTGLGLSLVRNMAVTQGGTINVSSKVGEGTTVTVALPFQRAAVETPDGSEAEFWQTAEALCGLRVKLCGFEREVRTREKLCAEDPLGKSQYQILEGICRDLLRMEVLPEHHDQSPPPDIVICQMADGRSKMPDSECMRHTAHCPYIFVCHDLASAYKLTDPKRGGLTGIYEVCSQPLGPRKLTSTLLSCGQRHQETKKVDNNSATGMGRLIETVATQQVTETVRPVPRPVDATLKLAEAMQKAVIAADDAAVPDSSQNPAHLTKEPSPLQPTHGVVIKPGAVDSNPIMGVPDPRKPILIIDDNDINLKIMAAYLTKLKYTYATAINGLEALEMYTSAPDKYSCLLTDISMPVMDGLDSTRRIREFEAAGGLKPVVVIALTGLSGPEVRQNALASGVDLFLTRPLPLRGLKEALAKVELS